MRDKDTVWYEGETITISDALSTKTTLSVCVGKDKYVDLELESIESLVDITKQAYEAGYKEGLNSKE